MSFHGQMLYATYLPYKQCMVPYLFKCGMGREYYFQPIFLVPGVKEVKLGILSGR